VPNSVAQVAAAIEDKRGYRSPSQGSPNQYNQGRAFAAPRKQSLLQLGAKTLPTNAIEELTHQLDCSPRKMHGSRNSTDQLHHHTVSNTSNRLEGEDSSGRQHCRQRSFIELKGPRLQTSTSGIGFDGLETCDPSDLKSGAGSRKTRIDGQIQRELSIARKRSKDLGYSSGWRNIALEEAEKTKTGEKDIEWV